MNIYRLIISGILTLSFVLPLVASAQTITLRAIGGRITITGELLEFDGLRYLVETRVGDVSFRVDEVECIAGDCPEIPETVAETEPEVDTSPAPVSEPEPDSTPIVNSNTSLPTITVDEVLNVEQPVAQPIESSVTIAPSAPEAPSPSIQPAVPTLDTQPTSAESPSSPTIETEAATNATSSPAEGIGGEFNMAGSQTIAEALMPQLIEA